MQIFTFEIDSENALVGCKLERWRLHHVLSVPTSDDFKTQLKFKWLWFAIGAFLDFLQIQLQNAGLASSRTGRARRAAAG